MTEFPTELILANCIFRDSRPLIRSNQDGWISFRKYLSDLELPEQFRRCHRTVANRLQFSGREEVIRGCPCVPSQNTESMLANAASWRTW
jgi:hypothetical protein